MYCSRAMAPHPRRGAAVLPRQGRRMFFFEKKNQKTFARCRGPIPGTYAKDIKVFCFFFSKKKTFSGLPG
jgi:hypothetical protein